MGAVRKRRVGVFTAIKRARIALYADTANLKGARNEALCRIWQSYCPLQIAVFA